MVRRRLLAILLASSLPLGGCKGCHEQTAVLDDAGDHARANTLTAEQGAQVLARVGDRTITLGDYAAALEHMDQFDRLRYQSPERRKELLQEMITVELLALEATTKGYDKDPLAQQELRSILRDAMLAEARKGAPTAADIPEADVHAYFDAHKDDYKDPERRRISIVLLRDEASAKQTLADAKKVTSPAQWGEIVRSRSVDSHARDNVPPDLAGDLGITSPPGDPRGENTRVPERVRVAAFAATDPTGLADDVVAVQGKFYVVRVTQKLAPHERTFEEAERTIRVKLAQDKLRAKEDDLLADLKKSVKVEVDEAALATVHVDVDVGADAGH